MKMRMALVGLLAIVSVLSMGGPAGAAVPEKSKPLSEKQFRKSANTICAQANQLLDQAATQSFPGATDQNPPTAAQLQQFIILAEPIFEQQIDGIAALKPPSSLKPKVKKLLDAARDETDAFVADPTTALESNPFAETEKASTKLGLRECD